MAAKEPTGRPQTTPWRDQHVDDPPELIDRTVDVAHRPATFTLVSSTCQRSPTVSAWPGGLGEQRSEALDPPVDGGVVDVNAALGEELLDERGTTTRSAGTEHREDDHLGREAEASEGRSRDREAAEAARAHGHTLPTRASHTQQVQQCRRPSDWVGGRSSHREAKPPPPPDQDQAPPDTEWDGKLSNGCICRPCLVGRLYRFP